MKRLFTTLFLVPLVAFAQPKLSEVSALFGTAGASSSFDSTGGLYNVFTNSAGNLVTNWWGKHGGFGGHDYFGNFYVISTNGYMGYSNAGSGIMLRFSTTPSNAVLKMVSATDTNSVNIGTNRVSVMMDGNRVFVVTNDGTIFGNGSGITNLSTTNLVGIATNYWLYEALHIGGSGVSLGTGNNISPPGGVALAGGTVESRYRCQLGWSGYVTQGFLDIPGANPIGPTTNVFVFLYTNGVACHAIDMTYQGVGGSGGTALYTNVVFATPLYIPSNTIASFVLSNNAALPAEYGYSLKYQVRSP